MDWRRRVALLTVLIEGLSEQNRFSLFDQFRNDIGDFFEFLGEKSPKRWLREKLPSAKALVERARVSVVAKLPISTMVTKGTDGVDTFEISFGIKVPLKVAWRFSVNGRKAAMRFNWETDEGAINSLAREIKGLPVEARYCLWALLDDYLADYEDHLLTTDPKWQCEQEIAWQEWGMRKGRWLAVE
ncbi:MAG: hypothetical protein ACK40X_07350 [Armatimonadota bacterium]